MYSSVFLWVLLPEWRKLGVTCSLRERRREGPLIPSVSDEQHGVAEMAFLGVAV
jgi:hypothetical protein